MAATGTITSAGIGSGLDVAGIVSKLMAVESQPVTLLQTQEAAVQTTLTGYGTLKSALSQFQTAMTGLVDPTKFQSVSASAADTTVASVTAGSAAIAGSYGLEVSQLAQSQKLTSVGQAGQNTAIGTGTISFDFGTISGGTLSTTGPTTGQYTGATYTSAGSATKTVTIDSSNNTLSGIRDAINNANLGVTATIINDGSSTPYRLSLTVNNSGAANSLKISVGGGNAALGALLNQDPAGTQSFTQTQAAQNATFKLDGVAITKPSNSVTDVISGVTVNLLKTNVGTPTTVTVAQNTTAETTAVNSFVAAYNAINKTFSDATAYDPTTKSAASLNGENSVLSIQSQIRNVLLTPVLGAPSTASKLEQFGVTFQKDGSLSVDSTKLQAALTANPQGIGMLFASQGAATDNQISYSKSSILTKPGTYAVNVSQLARQGSTTAGSAPTSMTIVAGSNDSLQIQLDGLTSTITIPAGTYNNANLAAAIQGAINGNATFSAAGSSAAVTQNNGTLTITSNKFGAASSALITGGNGQININGTGTVTTVTGLDVAGTINGVPALGSGQTLAGATSDASSGLAINITGGSTGARGTVSYTQGYAYQLNNLMTTVLGATGQIASRTDELNANTKTMDAAIAEKNIQLAQIQANYQAEFTALDVTISQLNSTSSFLTQELASLAR